ncbi:hypothetical protein DCAR_0831706 [Daucus carota subsp. sativus]|uniref:Agenet domain-containing protein n=1 Tax=Daucus carota subsp. sativus TaxID=79200 RepID=A0AAF0XQ50_DAUCS|nr:hypothetical protein DCAR_0831706 [Daucus carota subsp. sativus]
MDYDDKISEGHKSANAENSKSSPVVPPFALPKYDFDDSLQGDLRFEGLVENEVFLGISSQEDSQWIEDFSRGNNGIEFSSSATEPCSISRHNNVWSEATSSESVAMLLKSVGQEERIQGETLIQELDTGNELGNLATEMEPNLKKDDKVESITTSQPTATPDSFLDRRNVNAVESKKDNVPVDGSSGVVSIVSSVILSEADEGPDDKCDDTTHLKVNIIDQPVDNLEGCNIDQGSAVTSQLGNVEVGACNKGEKTSEPIQNPLGDTSSVACVDAHTFEVVNKDAEYSACTGVEVSIVELKENSFGNQPNSLERQNVEAVDIKTVNSSCPEHDMDSVVENENSENCSGGVAVAEASSLLAADHKFTEQVEGSGIEYAENPDTSVSCIVSGSQCGIQLSSKDSSDLRTSGVLEDNNSPEAQTSSFVVGGHVQMSKSHISSGQEDVHLFDKDVSSLGTEDAKSLTTSLPPDESNKANIVQGAELLNSASNERAGAGENVQSAALHMEHDNSNEGTNISMEVSSSTGLSESEIIKGSPSYPSIPVNKISTVSADCSRIDLTMPEHSLENSEGPGPMSGKKRAGARGTSERKTRLGSVKTTARTNSRKRGMQETPSKQFDEDKSMMISSLPGNSNAELSGIKVCGALPTPMSTIPDLNTSVTPAYYQQPFTDTQQVQLRAQILVYGSLMQNSVPDEACMIAAFGPSDGSGGCLWECAWRACSERIQTQKSDASNLETPVRSFSAGSKGSDQPVKKSKSSRQSKSTLPADRASSKDIPSPVVNPIIPLSSPLWNVSTPSGVGLQSSGTYVDYHQPFGPLQPCQPQGTKGFGEQNPSWLSQINFPGQWVATPQTSSLDVNASVSSKFCTEPVKLTPSKVSSVPSDPARKQTQFSVSTGGSAGLSSGIHFQTDVTKTSVLPGQICDNTKHKKRKKVSVSKSPGQIPSLTLDQAASLSDTSNHISKKGTAPQAIFQNSLLAPSLPEMRSPAVNNASSMPNAATATFLGSTGRSSNNLPAVYPLVSSDQPTRVDQIVDKNSIMSEESLNAVEAARLQAEGAAAHAAAAVGNCNGVWSQLSKLKNSGLRFDDETKLSSAAMAIAAAASVAKAAAAAAKLASNIAIGAKLMADEVSTASVTRKDPHSTGMSMACSSNSSLLAGEGNVSTSSIITAAKETVKKRVEAATAASKHAENLDAMVKAAELAAEAVSQAGKIVSIGDPLPLSELLGSGPMDYWRTPQVFPEQGVIAGIDQRKTFVPEKLVPAQPPKDGAIVTGEAVFKEGGKYKAAWYPAKILNSDDEKAFVCYTELQADDGSGKLKEWVPLKGDNSKAPIIRIPHPATSMCFERSRKRRRAAVMDYTWCVGDRVDAWMQDCWLEGVVSEKKNDETTFKISIPALGGTSAVKTWNLRPTVTWQDGKWIECPSAVQQSPTQGDTPQEKRVKLGHPAVEAAKVDKSLRGNDLMESKEHDESRQLPLLASEKEFNIGNNTGDIKLDAPRIARTGLQKEGSRVVFGVPKPGKKRKFMDVSKHLDSDQCNKNAKTSDLVKTARYLPQGRGGGRGWNNNTKDDIKEKQAKEDKVKVIRSGVAQKTNALLSAKSMGKTVSKEQNNPALRDLMEFGSVSNSPSEGPTSSKGPRVPNKRVPSSSTKTVLLNKGKHAAGGEVDKKVDPHVTEIRRSNRKIQPTSRLLEGLQSSLIGSKMPSVPHEKVQKNLNRD